jgi:hypothetical protein
MIEGFFASNLRRMAKIVSTRLLSISLGIILFASGGIYAMREYGRRPMGTEKLKPAFHLQASKLVSQFEQEESTATSKYADKVISIYGPVVSINITDSSAAVFVGGQNGVSSVMCQFDRDHLKGIHKLKPGYLVTIKGICAGYLMDVVMVRCVLELNQI